MGRQLGQVKISIMSIVCRRERDKSKTKNPDVKRTIICIRHGQYETDGKTDKERRLTPLGRMQAKLTGKRLRGKIQLFNFNSYTNYFTYNISRHFGFTRYPKGRKWQHSSHRRQFLLVDDGAGSRNW